jgi:hypothetical protein
MSTLVVVDGHNVFNDAGRLLAQRPGAKKEDLQAYFAVYFDIDRLISANLASELPMDAVSDLGSVIFHSQKKIGGGEPYALDGQDVAAFWSRQGAAPNTSTLLVEVPGAPSGKDVGMDVAMVVYLFETAKRWEAAVLMTQDADFAPAVWSLRRRGKRVYCSSPSTNEAQPLVQACQSFLPWNRAVLELDFRLFEVLQPGGLLDAIVECLTKASGHRAVSLAVRGARIEISGGFNDSVVNVVNEMLRVAGAKDLYALSGGGQAIVLQAREAKIEEPILALPHADKAFLGVTRHHSVFAKAAWHAAFRTV